MGTVRRHAAAADDVAPLASERPASAWVPPAARLSFAAFVLITAGLPALRSDRAAWESSISSFLVGDFGWLAVASFFALALGGALRAEEARASGEPRRRVLFLVLSTYAVSALVAGLTAPSSAAHIAAAATAFATVPVAVVLAARAHRVGWFLAITVSFAAWPLLPFGLAERLTTLLEVAWLVSTSPASGWVHGSGHSTKG